MKSMTATEASRHFSDLLNAVERGETMTIPGGNQPVAEIGAARRHTGADLRTALDFIERNSRSGYDRLAAADTGIDLDMLPRFQQGWNLPSLHLKRLQHLNELVDDQVALLPHKIHGVIRVRKVDRRPIRDEPVGGQVIAQA